ncbi:MAG: FHA domain-containing protein, partial [Planctomycetota bacterium]
MVRLEIESAEHHREVTTDETVVTIGRTSQNTVRIADDQSSRQHCRLERLDDGSWKLIDLASRNGTHLNETPVDEAPLRHGDKIRIGSTTITFLLPTEERAAAEVAGHATPAAPEAEPSGPKAITLAFLAGPNQGRSIVVFEKLTTIGRRPNNDIVLNDRGVSNRHAEIRRGPSAFILVDEGSRNGTFVNGRLTLRSPLTPGDQIRIGKSVIEVRAGDAQTTSQIAVETEGYVRDGSGFITAVEDAEPAPAWGRTVATVLVALAVAAGMAYLLRGTISDWIGAGPPRSPGLLSGRGTFDGEESRRAWEPDPDSDVRFEKGTLALQLPPRGPVGSLAACDLVDPLEIEPSLRYRVTARVRADSVPGGLAGVLATWSGEGAWGPHAGVLLRPGPDGDGPWAAVERSLIAPSWAEALELSCVARANSGAVLFDDLEVRQVPGGEELRLLSHGPLRLAMDTPVLFSLSHEEGWVTVGAGVVVEPAEGGAAVRQRRAMVAGGYPKAAGGGYHVRSQMALAPHGIQLSVDQTVSHRQDGLRLEVRLWTPREARVAFAGLELPCPAALLRPSVDVRTASGFYAAGRDESSWAFEDAEGLTLHLDRGKVFVACDAPLFVAGRVEGARGALRIGQRGGSLRTSPLTIALTARGTTPEEEQEVVSQLVAAERAARQGRYAEALGRYQEIARLYP